MNKNKWLAALLLLVLGASSMPCLARRPGRGRIGGRGRRSWRGPRRGRGGIGFGIGVGTGYPGWRRRGWYGPRTGFWWSVGSPRHWWWDYRYDPAWEWIGGYPLFWESYYAPLIRDKRWDRVERRLSDRIDRLEAKLERERISNTERRDIEKELDELWRHKEYAIKQQ